MPKSGSGNSGRRNNAGGSTGSKAKPKSGPGNNAQHGNGGQHSQTAKGNNNSGGPKGPGRR